jgi:hypothetical protein
MRSKILVVLIAVAVTGVSSIAMARGGGGGGGSGGGGGGGGGGKGGSGGHVGHTQFVRPHFDHRFQRNNQFIGGSGWGLGWPYGENGYSNTNVIVYPQATPLFASGSAATPCHWNSETFTVPSSAGGSRPVEVVACR